VDGTALHGTGPHQKDQFQHLAKVRVAGSNPVFRSNRLPLQKNSEPKAEVVVAPQLFVVQSIERQVREDRLPVIDSPDEFLVTVV
jgi:hypothetical protein